MAISMGLAVATLALMAQSVDGPAPTIDNSYEPSTAYPFGRPNPDAPAQLADFAFFIGAFNCTDSQRRPDGTMVSFQAQWNGHYFMNGHGIQDQYWAPGFYTSNIRLFDERVGKWKVTFFAEPGYSTGTWVGGRSGDDIVLERTTIGAGGTDTVSKLTFYEISDAGFRWRGQSSTGDDFVTTWTSDCVKQ